MLNWLNRPLGKNKSKIQPSPPRESKDGLIVEDRAPEEVSSDSPRSILNTAIADAEQIAASIKMRAQAEAEAAGIIAEAKIEAQEIRGKAEIAAQREAEDILLAAKKKAEISEIEAKQKTLQFLVTASEEIEREIGEEYRRAYSRLSSSLQNLVNEGQNISVELKSKTEKFWESKGVSLKEYKARLISTSEAAAPTVEASAPVEAELKPGTAEKEVVEQLAQPEERVTGEKIEEPVEVQKEAVEGAIEQSHEEKGEPASVKLDRKASYAGEVELVIASPVELKLVSKLYNYLQTVPELKILYTRGSWDRGTTITVVLEKPLSLLGILSEMPDVKVTTELLEKDNPATGKSGLPLKGGEKVVKRIRLILEEAKTI